MLIHLLLPKPLLPSCSLLNVKTQNRALQNWADVLCRKSADELYRTSADELIYMFIGVHHPLYEFEVAKIIYWPKLACICCCYLFQ